MTDKAVVEHKQERDVQRVDNTPAAVYLPDVDIRESTDALEVVADLPGVDKSNVEVTVEKGVLSISGTTSVEAPEGYTLVHRDFVDGRYRRDFTLSDRIETDAIKARVADGVVTVTLPKREEVKTRKIEITS